MDSSLVTSLCIFLIDEGPMEARGQRFLTPHDDQNIISLFASLMISNH
jgi:hypothetical protein